MKFRHNRHMFGALAVLALGATLSPARADTDKPKTPVELPAPPAGEGQVVFFRKPLFSLIPFNWIAREGKTEICEMVAGTYCVATVAPGPHTYEVHSEATNRLTLEVDAGETYYVIGGISMGLVVNHPNISPAQKAQFDALSYKLTAKQQIAGVPGSTPSAAPGDAASAVPAEPAPAAPAAAASTPSVPPT
jgi:hypothetical protein